MDWTIWAFRSISCLSNKFFIFLLKFLFSQCKLSHWLFSQIFYCLIACLSFFCVPGESLFLIWLSPRASMAKFCMFSSFSLSAAFLLLFFILFFSLKTFKVDFTQKDVQLAFFDNSPWSLLINPFFNLPVIQK